MIPMFSRKLLLAVLIALTVSACQTNTPTAAPEETTAPQETSAPSASNTPAFTDTPAATATPDPFFSGNGELKSGSGSAEVTLRIVNNSASTLNIIWINYDGGEEPYSQVSPGLSQSVSTYSTHAWRLSDDAGNVVAEFIATDEESQVYEISSDLKVVYQPTPPLPPTFGPGVPTGERATADRPDDVSGVYQIHFLYVLPSDATDRNRDTDGTLDVSTKAVNEWLSGQTEGSTLRFDTYQGVLDVTFVQLDMTSDQVNAMALTLFTDRGFIRDVLEAKLASMNVFQPGKLYVSVFEISKHPSTCADGAHPPDLMGRMAGLYPSAVLDGGYNCASESYGPGAPSYTNMGIIHEIVHLLGYASDCGKNPTSADNKSHTGDNNSDLMWAPAVRGTGSWDTDNMQLDPGNDDYYKHSISGCPDLANSAFLEPLPAQPETPPAWPADWLLP